MADIKCPNCNYEGKGRYRITHWFIVLYLLFMGMAIIGVWNDKNYSSAIIGGMFFMVPALIYGAKEFCPKCDNKQIVRK